MLLLLTSDWHIKNDNGTRTDDFQQVQINTLKFIAKIARENKATIIHAGDVFHKSKQENMQELLNSLYEIFKDINVYFIAGNHDLLQHSMSNFYKCNIGLLNKFNNWKYLKYDYNEEYFIGGFSFNEQIKNNEYYSKLNIACIHKYCEKENLPSYIKNGVTAKELLDNYIFDIFVIGDNHKSFIYEKDNRFVFNTGCCTRQNIAEKDYKPSVILFDTESLSYEQIFLPDTEKGVFREEKLTDQIKDNNRLNSFIEMIGNNKSISFNFENNIKKHCLDNNINNEVIKEIDDIFGS